MTYYIKPPSNFKATKPFEANWASLRKGLNLFLRSTELGRDEYAQGDNIMLIGSGVPTGRWGSTPYFTANATGSIRGIATFDWAATTSKEIIALTDQGYLVKKNGINSTVITGISYPSGTEISAEQLGNATHFVSKDVPFASYNGTSMVIFATISPPTGVFATNTSGTTGTNIVSYKVVQLGPNGGQTTPSTNYVLNGMPQDLTTARIRVSWVNSSGLSLSGAEIYRGSPGDETLLASVGPTISEYYDVGDEASLSITAPITNTTGGIKSKIIKKIGDRLILVPYDDPSKLVITGRYPNHTKTSWADGGGYVYIDPDNSREITGVEVQPNSNKIIVYKEFSSYAAELSTITIGNYQVLDINYLPISTSVGASNPKTVVAVENDIFYFGRKGLYVTGYEPNFLSLIRTNEISAKIRPYLAELTDTDYKNACAFYVDNKYILSFPTRKEAMIYDRERGCFAGLWKFPFGLQQLKKVVDSTGTEKWLFGTAESNIVYSFETTLNTDNGTNISKTLLLNKEAFTSFKDMKSISMFYILFTAITGSVSVNIIGEDRVGMVSTIKTFTITGSEASGSMGYGAALYGSYKYGTSAGTPNTIDTDEVLKWGTLFKDVRLVQTQIATGDSNSNFEFLKLTLTATKQESSALANAQRV